MKIRKIEFLKNGFVMLYLEGDLQNKESKDFLVEKVDDFFNGLGLPPSFPRSGILEEITGGVLKPRLDLSATDKEYTISVEIPGVSEKDVNLELVHDTLIIRGEKNQKKEEKKKNFYRLERSYGAFQRTLSLPEDADSNNIKADFKNGVLNITIPRMEITSGTKSKQIDIK